MARPQLLHFRPFTLRDVATGELSFKLEIEPECPTNRGQLEPQVERQIDERLAAGDATAWCVIRVVCRWWRHDIAASDAIGRVCLAGEETPEWFAQNNGLYESALLALNEQIERALKALALRADLPDDTEDRYPSPYRGPQDSEAVVELRRRLREYSQQAPEVE